jgi:drug/metabolite transporter (DMT)-like permease
LRFFVFVVLGSVAQIVATLLLITLFSFRNFAVGTAFSKTETVQAALFGIVILSESVTQIAGIGILVSLVGVVMISGAKAGSLFNAAAGIGILSAAAFAISAVAYRAASLSLVEGDFMIRATTTLAVATTIQTVLMGAWITWREPEQWGRMIANGRTVFMVSLTGMLASLGWFSAMTLQYVAYVRALAQVELVFTFIASVFFFRETSTRAEVIGIILIMAGIVILLLG